MLVYMFSFLHLVLTSPPPPPLYHNGKGSIAYPRIELGINFQDLIVERELRQESIRNRELERERELCPGHTCHGKWWI